MFLQLFGFFSSFALFFSSKMSTFPLPLQDMPKCADVRLQLGSENLLQDIRDVAFLRKLQRLGSYTFGKALNNAMKQGRGQGSTPWICPSSVLARPLEAHERRHRHPEFDVWIVVGIAAKTWRREISCWDKVLIFSVVFGTVSCWEELDVSREIAHETPSFHSLGLVSQGCGTTFGLECWRLKGNGSFFLRTTLVMHASVLGTRTLISIQWRLRSALGCPVLAHLHSVSWKIFESWRMTEAFLFPLARQM